MALLDPIADGIARAAMLAVKDQATKLDADAGVETVTLIVNLDSRNRSVSEVVTRIESRNGDTATRVDIRKFWRPGSNEVRSRA